MSYQINYTSKILSIEQIPGKAINRRVHAANQFSVKTHTPNLGDFKELLLGLLLMLSALTGSNLIAIFFFRKIF